MLLGEDLLVEELKKEDREAEGEEDDKSKEDGILEFKEGQIEFISAMKERIDDEKNQRLKSEEQSSKVISLLERQIQTLVFIIIIQIQLTSTFLGKSKKET